MSGVSDLMAFDTRQNKNQKVPIDFVNNKQFYTTADLVIKKREQWARGGKIKDSSIRIELPGFLEESYDYRGQQYQEHTKFHDRSKSQQSVDNSREENGKKKD